MHRTKAQPTDLLRWGMESDQQLRESQYKAAYRNDADLEVKCEWCLKPFKYNPKGNWRKFCCNKCRAAATRANKKKALDNQNLT